MLIVKASSAEIRKRNGRFDRTKIEATTEAVIEQIEEQEGYGDAAEAHLGPAEIVVPGPNVKTLRAKLRMNQDDFADRFGL